MVPATSARGLLAAEAVEGRGGGADAVRGQQLDGQRARAAALGADRQPLALQL
jgi:hypothetical protein